MGILNQTEETVTPTNPDALRRLLFPKSTGWFDRDSTGAEKQLATLTGVETLSNKLFLGVLNISPTLGSGYGTGAGGAVTQITSRTTGVLLNRVTGAITLVSATGTATPATFVVTNTTVAITDTVSMSLKNGTADKYVILTTINAGSFEVTFYTTGGVTVESPVFNFNVIKGVTS